MPPLLDFREALVKGLFALAPRLEFRRHPGYVYNKPFIYTRHRQEILQRLYCLQIEDQKKTNFLIVSNVMLTYALHASLIGVIYMVKKFNNPLRPLVH